MKNKTLYILFLAISFSSLSFHTSFGQALSMNAKKLEAVGKPGDFVETDCELKNLSGSEIQVRVLRSKANMPNDWATSFCLVNCYAPEALDITENVPANGTFDFRVTWSTGANAGSGEVEYTLTNLAVPSEKFIYTFRVSTGQVGVERVPAPKALTLAQNYPNPFTTGSLAVTSIGYTVPKQSMVSVKVYNLVGREVRTLINEVHAVGNYSIAWDGKDSEGALVSPGLYIYKINAGASSVSRRMVLSR
jgi:hypothetical protein